VLEYWGIERGIQTFSQYSNTPLLQCSNAPKKNSILTMDYLLLSYRIDFFSASVCMLIRDTF